GDSSGNGHYKATCYYCNESWKRGKPQAMKAHLANQCNSCPEDISAHWRKKLAEEINKYTRKSAPVSTNIHKPLQNDPLPYEINNHLDQSLLKAWIMTGIPFEIIENPFMRDFIKKLNPQYIPPSRTTLSGRLLDAEVARVTTAVYNELEHCENLTL
ncbi:12911_t:CDS:1, partial [Racocetra fulgida]